MPEYEELESVTEISCLNEVLSARLREALSHEDARTVVYPGPAFRDKKVRFPLLRAIGCFIGPPILILQAKVARVRKTFSVMAHQVAKMISQLMCSSIFQWRTSIDAGVAPFSGISLPKEFFWLIEAS